MDKYRAYRVVCKPVWPPPLTGMGDFILFIDEVIEDVVVITARPAIEPLLDQSEGVVEWADITPPGCAHIPRWCSSCQDVVDVQDGPCPRCGDYLWWGFAWCPPRR